MNGNELLREFRQQRSEHAFAELVQRYARLVFSVAKRRLNNDALAQEASQAVFIRLANNPPDLPNDPALLGWLHRTALHVSVDAWRAESRRRTYEQKAAAMQTETTESFQPNGLSLEVDEALDELGELDRTALLLRFFDGRKMAELGAVLGISEDAAKMRVSRSLERLRERLAVRGIKTTAAFLAGYLGEQALLAMPATLAGAILQALPNAAPTVPTTASTWIGQIARPRFAALLVAIIVPSAFLMRSAISPNKAQRNAATQTSAGANASAQGLGAPNLAAAGTTNSQLDPRALLEGVVRARSRIGSGNLEIHVVHDQTQFHPVRETNLLELRIVFDGLKRRFEQTGFEYSYVGVNEEGERSKQVIDEKKMSRVEAVRAGLLTQFESRHVSVYDGATILDYWENDGRPVSATIDNPDKGTSQYLFDPRLLGLGTSLRSALETSLALNCAQDMKILGEEAVEGTPAWHIQVNCAQYRPEFWLSINQPERVLKYVSGYETIVSRYSLNQPRDPLPTEVVQTIDHPIGGVSRTRFTRRATEYNTVVDPESFTLKGLGMQIGVWVTDTRVSRSLGYWNGAGFSERQPKEKDRPATDAPKMEELLYLVDQEPSSEKGLEAALWIIRNTPDGDEVEKAGRAILDYHLQSTNLLGLAERFEELRPRCSKPILKGLLASNPDIETRAVACLSLGLTYLEEAEFGVNKEATREARTYLNRVLTDFMKTKKGYARHHYAKRGIQEIDNFFIGHKAPDLRGETIGGEAIDTGALSGHVILLLFSSGSTYEYRGVLEKFTNQPVTVVEISCETKLEKTIAQLEKDKITWPVIFDGNYGPIAEAWLVNHWTTTFLIDRNGIIRARDQRGPDLAKAIEAALH